jgi:uncharacterized membrane protein HdeD (DUF308 family)
MTDIPTAPTSTGWVAPAAREKESLFPWWTLLLLGAVSLLFGIAVLVWPGATLKVLAVLVGIWLLLAGTLRIVGAFLPGRGVGRQVLSGIVGVILFIGGVVCLRNLVNALAVLAVIVSLSWLFSGLSATLMAFQATGAIRAGLLIVGILSILVGLVFLFVPGLSLAAVVLLIGISAIVIGAGELVLAFQIRKAGV